MKISGTKFESEIPVRPSDIDMNQHVHNTMYLEYVFAARFDQMERCYKMSMNEFLDLGYSWVVRKAYIEHNRGLLLGDVAIVRTWVDEAKRSRVTVRFEIFQKSSGRLSASGYLEYVMIRTETGRPVAIPEFIMEKYSV